VDPICTFIAQGTHKFDGHKPTAANSLKLPYLFRLKVQQPVKVVGIPADKNPF